MNAPCTVIVLAAGMSSRFGGPGHKLTQPLDGPGDEHTVLGVTLRNVLASRLPLVVVTSADVAPLAERLLGAERVLRVAPQRNRGVGDSIAAGVASQADASGWLVLPGDMPCVQPQTFVRVAEALKTHAVAYAQLRGRRGHPVGFSAELYSELVSLTADEGARRLVARYPAEAVEVEDVGVLQDIDTLQDLAMLRAVHGAASAQERG
ncbi:MAG: nucleotidyltransferase family protein [Burkholderiaceae bacterium]